MKSSAIITLLYLLCNTMIAQTKVFSKNCVISFFSKAPLENITAKNNSGLCVWNLSDGNIEFSVLMKGFEFEKALMQEHFNENYVESDKYPKAVFKGVAEGSKDIQVSANQVQKIKVNGTLTIHGITHSVSIPAIFKVQNGIMSSSANFSIILADYNIKIPTIASGHISKEITIFVDVPVYKILNNL